MDKNTECYVDGYNALGNRLNRLPFVGAVLDVQPVTTRTGSTVTFTLKTNGCIRMRVDMHTCGEWPLLFARIGAIVFCSLFQLAAGESIAAQSCKDESSCPSTADITGAMGTFPAEHQWIPKLFEFLQCYRLIHGATGLYWLIPVMYIFTTEPDEWNGLTTNWMKPNNAQPMPRPPGMVAVQRLCPAVFM